MNENSKKYDNYAQNTIKDSDVYKLLLEIPAGKVVLMGILRKHWESL